jgi:membrane protease YdiL (CAAX protease family)
VGLPPALRLRARHPAPCAPAELAFLGACLILVVGFLTWGLEAIHQAFPTEPAKTVAVTAAKLLVFVALPVLGLRAAFGYRWVALAPVGGGRPAVRAALVMSGAMLLVQALVGRGLTDVHRSDLRGIPLAVAAVGALAWACLEAGLVEELFFRTLLQSRLAAWLRSQTGAVVVMCLLFGLAHAPGFYLRTGRTLEGLGSNPSLLLAAGYAVVVTSTVGFAFGVLWARTRNLWLLVLVHGVADWLQGIVPFADAWRLR